MDKVRGILYYRTAAMRWQDSMHSKALKDAEKFIRANRDDIEHITLVSATGSYSILCFELVDDTTNGTFQREVLVEFDTKAKALEWANQIIEGDLLCDHQL